MPSAEPWAEVWGQPIGHSLSPVLHAAAYRELGLEWEYRAREVGLAGLRDAFEALEPGVRGLSLTMPLKEAILGIVPRREPVVHTLGVANTVVFGDSGPSLTNTDPLGVVGALADAGVSSQVSWIVGAGATARAVGYALSLTPGTTLCLVVRDETRAEETARILRDVGAEVIISHQERLRNLPSPGLVVSTLPGGSPFPFAPSQETVGHSAFFDVAYHPWPSDGAKIWLEAGQPAVSGLSMLVHQALHQIRWFVQGHGEGPLEGEDKALWAMKSAVGLATS